MQVKRRTHQTVEVPELPDQEVFQTLVNLPIEEREGGYQDRTPGKNARCAPTPPLPLVRLHVCTCE